MTTTFSGEVLDQHDKLFEDGFLGQENIYA